VPCARSLRYACSFGSIKLRLEVFCLEPKVAASLERVPPLGTRTLHDFSTNSPRILHEFLRIFWFLASFRVSDASHCKSLSVHAKPDLSVWRVLKVPDRALPPLQGNLGRYPWLHESSLSSLSCNLLVILITQLTYLINSLSIAYQ
jgi:hypothetical protein